MADTSFDDAFSLAGQTALITGGASGIGFAIAKVFAGRGARLALVDLDPHVAETARSLGQQHIGLQVDVSAEGAPKRTVDEAAARLGRLDILVNNAGIARLAPAGEATRPDWDLTMAVNLTAPFLFAQAASVHMLKQGSGRIVNLASQAATVALQNHVAYCTSKAAIVGMTKGARIRMGSEGHYGERHQSDRRRDGTRQESLGR